MPLGAIAEAELDETEDPTEAITAVESHIKDADTINDTLGPWKDYDRSQEELTEATIQSDRLTVEIRALETEEADLLKAAEIPVRGITFSAEGGMLLDGQPIEVNSGMRKLDMTCDIAFASNSDIRVILLDEATAYGPKALARLDERAKEKGWQVLGCTLRDDDEVEIVVKDGAAKN